MSTTRWWIPSRKKFGGLCAGSALTFALLYFDGHGRQFFALDIAYRLNDKAVRESLSVKVAIITTLVALAPAVIAMLLAMGIRSRADKERCVELMMLPMDVNYIPEAFPPDKWLNSPAGVLGYIYLLDILSAKAGASIFSTAVGVFFYLIVEGQPIYFLLLSCVLLMYAISIFPAYIRHIFALSYRKRCDAILRYHRRRFLRKMRARYALVMS